MSVYLHGLAMKANLSVNLKFVFMALCDAAGEDDGSNCHPSIEYIAYKTGFSVRHCRRILRALEAAEYIEPTEWIQGGRGHTTHYHIHIKRVPMKPNWGDVKAALIAEGRYTADEQPASVKRGRKGAQTQKADILSPIEETPLKADILSPITGVKADILSPITPERRTFCPPNTLSSINIPKESEDSYAPERDTSPSEHLDSDSEPDEPDPRAVFDAAYPDVTAWARKTGRRWGTSSAENAAIKDAFWLAQDAADAAHRRWLATHDSARRAASG